MQQDRGMSCEAWTRVSAIRAGWGIRGNPAKRGLGVPGLPMRCLAGPGAEGKGSGALPLSNCSLCTHGSIAGNITPYSVHVEPRGDFVHAKLSDFSYSK